MPRDLHHLVKEDSLQGMPQLSRSPEQVTPDAQSLDENGLFTALSRELPPDKRAQLHPYIQALTISDVESCTMLEEAAFEPHERATKEKFQYRLRVCGELCLGIFTSLTSPPDPPLPTSSGASVLKGTTTAQPARQSVLLGHLIATKTTRRTVTDADMAVPTQPEDGADDGACGHQEAGRTLCIHSLAVLPQYQGRGLGRTLLEAYVQRIESQGVADRVALIARGHLVAWYGTLGFRKVGKSAVQFGGGGWVDMVRELNVG